MQTGSTNTYEKMHACVRSQNLENGPLCAFQLFTKHEHTHIHTHSCQPCRPAHNVFHLNTLHLQLMLQGRETEIWREKKEREGEKEMQQRTEREINISGSWYRYIARKLRICSDIKQDTQFYYTQLCSGSIDFNGGTWLNLEFCICLLTPFLPFLSSSSPFARLPCTSLSSHLFSVTRGLVGDEPMSAEVVGRVGGTGKGRWRGEEGEWKAVSNADLFWADKRRLLCAKATGFNLGAATFGINYHTYSSTAVAYCVHWLLHPLQYKLYTAYVLELAVTQESDLLYKKHLHKIQLHYSVSVKLTEGREVKYIFCSGCGLRQQENTILDH